MDGLSVSNAFLLNVSMMFPKPKNATHAIMTSKMERKGDLRMVVVVMVVVVMVVVSSDIDEVVAMVVVNGVTDG